MGWEGDHLHLFDISGRRYGDPLAVDGVTDEERLTLNGVVKSGVARFADAYDFGDDWEHAITIEEAPAGRGPQLPRLPCRKAAAGEVAAACRATRNCSPSWPTLRTPDTRNGSR